ncbi:Histidine triad nucleotide-binding (HIT-like) protein [Mycoplasmopsis californica]|uniref:HIT family protein n=1 Tax=Mycoplasmopsis equigenitalium TaxID=114883 RepID=A0ABY5J129_9BACT|nr:HIT family protein [Mycoplasmopsis equigenitalium]UUD36961.1 HIT family protein [Mycoplasmopsis equigenitalium]VEU69744.1 Histidine triad nucleotide-binding (HIT-like) protein [Mycoplasmopsis californica]
MNNQANKSIFTKIIEREIPSKIYFEDKDVIVIWDIDQSVRGHLLVIWKEPYINLKTMSKQKVATFFAKANEVALNFIKEQNFDDYKLIINNGEKAGQEVMHSHIHILPY